MIRTLADLSEDYGVLNRHELIRYADEDYRAAHCYTAMPIPRRNGEVRMLHVPSPKLKAFQRYLLRLLEEAELEESAAAYRKGRDLRMHAQRHTGAAMLLKMDIADFFGSITFSKVFRAVDRGLAQSPWVGPHSREYERDSPAACTYNNELSWYIAQFCTLNGVLPQGAPTSPVLSNLVFVSLDRRIASYCEKRNISYSRYSDDLIFSGDFAPLGLIGFVRQILSASGYVVNEKKTVIAGAGRQKNVTGAVVNQRPQAPKEYRQSIRQEIYYIGKYGIKSHLCHKRAAEGYADEEISIDKAAAVSELRRLTGKIQFVLQLDPENQEFRQYKWECQLLMNLMTGVEE